MTSHIQPNQNRLCQPGYMHMARDFLKRALFAFCSCVTLVGMASLMSLCGVISNAQAAPSPGATCVVTAQNRTAPMNADGSYALYNLPGNGLIPFGVNGSAQPFRVRAVCDDGTLGETPMAFPNFEDKVVLSGDIIWGLNTPKPSLLTLAYPSSTLQPGQTLSPMVFGFYEDGSTQNLTQRATGTGYRSSSSLYVGVTANGDAYFQQVYGASIPSAVVITAENDGVVSSRVLSPSYGIQLSGTVYKPGGTVPVAGAKVYLLDYALEVTADANGQYRFDSLPSQGVRLIAYDPLSRSYVQSTYFVPPNTNTVKNLVLAGVGSVVVRVVDVNNVPLSGIDVAVADNGAYVASNKEFLAPKQILKTDAQGLVTLQGVAAGHVSPVLAIKGYSSTPASAMLLPDGTVDFTVMVTGSPVGGSTSLSGTISENGTGWPGVGIVVKLTELSGLRRSFSFLTGANGKYLFEGLQPSTVHQVSLLKSDTVIAQYNIVTGSAGTSTVSNFGFNRQSQISGVVRNSDGVTVAPNTTVQLSSFFVETWMPVKSIVTDAQGQYIFSPISLGRFRIDAIDQGGAVGTVEVTVASAGSSIVKDIILPGKLTILTQARLDVRDKDFISDPSLANAQIFVTNSQCVTPCLLGKTIGGVSFDTTLLPLGLNVFEARRGGSVAQASVVVDASTDGQTIQRTLLLSASVHETLGNMSFASQRSLYSFTAAVGDKVDLSVLGYAVQGTPAAYATKIELYNPSKQLIASGYGFAPPITSSSLAGAINSLTLDVAGEYTVVVSPYYSDPKYLGKYLLTLAVNGEASQLVAYAGGGTVEGKVFKKDGVQIAANQLVDLRTHDTLSLHERGLTDALGQFRFNNVPLADLTLSALRFDVVHASASDKLNTPSQVLVKDLVMPLGRISGTLTYQGGIPAQGVTLSIKLKNGLGAQTITTDAQGIFAFEDLAFGVYDAFDSKGNKISLDMDVTSGADLRVNWSLLSTPPLTIKVKRGNGTAVAGATVYGYYIGYPTDLGKTNSDGLLAVNSSNCPQYSKYSAAYPGNTKIFANSTTPPPACNQSQVMEVQFMPVADVHVVVTQNGNVPMAGAQIRNGQTLLGSTDTNGIFNIVGLVAGTYSLTVKTSEGMAQNINFVVDAASDGTIISRTADFATQFEKFGKLSFNGEKHLYSVSVKQGDTLAIMVHGALVDGIAGAYLVSADVYSPDKTLKASGYGYGSAFNFNQYNISGDLLNTTIDAGGNYVVAIKPYYLDYLGGYFLHASVNGQSVEIKPYQGGGSVQGTVFQVDGVTPLPNGIIDISTQDAFGLHIRTTTDAGGHYQFDNVPLADLTISLIEAEQVLVSAIDKLNIPAQIVVKDLTVPQKTTLQVSITIPNGNVIPYQMFFSVTDINGTRNVGPVLFSGNNTSNSIATVALGDSITLAAIHPSNANVSTTQVVSGTDGQTVAVNLLLESAVVSGTVFKSDGTPAPYSLVNVYRAADNAYITSTYSDNLGVYVLAALPVGQDLIIAAQNYLNQINSTINIMLSGGQQLAGQDITLIATGSIEGFVKLSSGVPVADASVVLNGTINGSSFNVSVAATDQNGYFHVDNVPVSADVQITVTTPGAFAKTNSQSTRINSAGQLVTLPDFTFISGASLQVNVFDGDHQVNPFVFGAPNSECGPVRIYITTANGVTSLRANGNGFDLLTDVPEGLAEVSYYGECSDPNWGDVPLATASIVIAANQLHQLDILVPIVKVNVSLAGGIPVAYPYVQITQVAPDGTTLNYYPTSGYGGSSNSDGAYRILGVSPGDFTISASAYGISGNQYSTATQTATMVGTANMNVDVVIPYTHTGPSTLIGTLKYSDGSVVPSANITLYQNGVTYHPWFYPWSGIYEFFGAPVGPFEISAQDAVSGVSVTAQGEVIDGVVTVLNLTLPPTGSVTGVVYDNAGSPLPYADVYMYSSGSPGIEFYAQSDAQGMYSFDRVLLGAIKVVAWNPNTGMNSVGAGTLNTNLETISVDLNESVSGPGLISGTVSYADGTTVPSADLTLSQNGISTYTIADMNGYFIFDSPLPDIFQLTAKDNTSGLSVVGTGTLMSGDAKTINLSLPSTGSVTGILYDIDGMVVPNVNVEVRSNGMAGWTRLATTDALGMFRIDYVPLGEISLVSINPVTQRAIYGMGTLSSNNEQITINLQEVLVSISGTVSYSDGTPVPSADISLDQNGIHTYTTTDQSGYYVFNSPLPGAFQITAKDLVTGLSATGAGTVVAGYISTANISMPLSGGVTGILSDINGGVLPNANVDVTSSGLAGLIRHTTTDAQGMYRVDYVPLGEIKLVGTNQLTQRIILGTGILSSNNELLTINLQEVPVVPGTISGTVSYSDGIPISSANLTLKQYGILTFVTTDSVGNYLFDSVLPYAFEVTAQDNATGLSAIANGIMTDSANMNVDVVIPHIYSGPGAIVGVVKFSDGTPAADMDVVLFQSQNGQTTYTITNRAGQYFIESPIIGAFEISAQDPTSSLLVKADGTLVAGTANRVDLVMPPAGSVIGTLYDINNNPIPNADVYVNSSGSSNLDLYAVYAATDAQGKYRFDRVAVGAITVTGYDPNTLMTLSGSGTLNTNHELITVDLHETAGGIVTGRVLADASGTPMSNAYVTLVSNRSYGAFWPLEQSMNTDASGAFNFGTAPPGGFKLFAWDPVNPAVIGISDGVAIMNSSTNLDVTLGNGTGFPIALTGSDGYQYNITCTGSLQNGIAPFANLAYELKINNSYFPCYPGAGISFDKRELTFGPATMETVQVTRRVFSPTAGGFVRYIETYTNTGSADTSINIQVGLSNFAYYSPLLIDPASNNQTYAVLGNPALVDVFGGLGGAPNPASTFRYQSYSYLDYLGVQTFYDTLVSYNWTLTVPSGKTVSLMHYAAPAADGLVAKTIADSLSANATPSMFDGIAPMDKSAIYNFVVP